MELKFDHKVSKKIDESGSIDHWFVLNKRPKGMFFLSLKFQFQDSEPVEVTVKFDSIKKTKWKEHVQSGIKTFGFFKVTVPQGDKKVLSITAAAIHGVLVRQVIQDMDIPVSEEFQDIVEEEKRFNLSFNLK